MVGTFIDITEKRNVELEQKSLQRAIDDTEQVFWTARCKDGSVGSLDYTFVSSGCERMFLIKKENFNKESVASILHRDYMEMKSVWQDKKRKFPSEYVYKIIRKDGRELLIREKEFKENNIYFGYNYDITDRKK